MKAQETVQLTSERVMASLAQTLFFDPRRLYHCDGTLKAVHELDDDTAMALTGLEINETVTGKGKERKVAGRTVKVKWLDKGSAREHAARILGLFERDNRQRADPLSQLIDEINKQRSSLPIVEQDAG